MKIIIIKNINGRYKEIEYKNIKNIQPNILSGGLDLIDENNNKKFISVDYCEGDSWEIKND